MATIRQSKFRRLTSSGAMGTSVAVQQSANSVDMCGGAATLFTQRGAARRHAAVGAWKSIRLLLPACMHSPLSRAYMGLRARGFRCGGQSVVFMSLSTLDETANGVGLSVRGTHAAQSSEVRGDRYVVSVYLPHAALFAP